MGSPGADLLISPFLSISRYWINTTASCSIAIATVFDTAVWYYVKDLVIFDKRKKQETADEDNQEGEGQEKRN